MGLKIHNILSLLLVTTIVIGRVVAYDEHGGEDEKFEGKHFASVVEETDDERVERKHVAVIGAGFAGLAAANELVRLGYRVTIYEKGDSVGGRARRFESPDGRFVFDAGPSWYWMPDLFDEIFQRFGANRTNLYNLTRLDPAYRVILPEGEEAIDVPGGDLDTFLLWAAGIDPKNTLEEFFMEAEEKYRKGVFEWIWKPMVSLSELIDFDLWLAALRMNMFGGYEASVMRHTSHPTLRMILKWPVIFVGASPSEAPAMYSLLSYAAYALGTWYPVDTPNGMAAPAIGLARLAEETGHVHIALNREIRKFLWKDSKATHVCYDNDLCEKVDGVVAAADYQYVEQHLLPRELRRYSPSYWHRRVMSPGCLLFYIGLREGGNLSELAHHTFFFDKDLDGRLRDVFETHDEGSSDRRVFYVTKHENSRTLFVLVPISYRLERVDASLREEIRADVLRRMENVTGVNISSLITYERIFGPSDFARDFHAWRGNAFGLANVLSQSLVLKPSTDSLASNLNFAGHLTTPGPGMPPAIVSGIVAANRLHERMKNETMQDVWKVMVWQLLRIAIGLFGVAHVATIVAMIVSRKFRSRIECVRLFYKHGRTFFAASTLMRSAESFLDTGAMYALFRVADDIVDEPGVPAETRLQRLDEFIASFWRARKRGYADKEDHLILPAVIETCVRNGYDRSLFERFFKSMRMDTIEDENICYTFEETMEYMDGSAAVIGDFMCTILMRGKEHEKAIRGARALGNAFQLTNMIRDVEEDLGLGREYWPRNMCLHRKVCLREISTVRESSNFASLVEDLFEKTDAFYTVADKAIDFLPIQAGRVVRVASEAYHGIHEKIRASNYDLFSGKRARLSFFEKLAIARRIIPAIDLFQMAIAEAFFFVFLRLYLPILAPLTVLMASMAWFKSYNDMNTISYATFHIWTISSILFLFTYAKLANHGEAGHTRRVLKWTLALCAVATIWTTPWDNYLVYRGIWFYADENILWKIGYVPIEEYAFFSLETILTGLVFYCIVPSFNLLERPSTSTSLPTAREIGIGRGVLACFVTAWTWSLREIVRLKSLDGDDSDEVSMEYLSLILVWSLPILTLQWSIGYVAILRNKFAWCSCVVLSTLSLSVADAWAIRRNIWTINLTHSLGYVSDFVGVRITGSLFRELPLEEFLFFAMTTLMCSWGLLLAVLVSQRWEESQQGTRLNAFKDALWEIHMWTRNARPSPPRLFGVFVAVLTIALGDVVDSSATLCLLVVGLAVVGIPHGALDTLVLLRSPSSTRQFCIYVLVMLLTLLLWVMSPSLGLVVFLASSWYHFGEADACGRRVVSKNPLLGGIVEILTRGGVFLIAIDSKGYAMQIFELLLGTDSSLISGLLLSIRSVYLVGLVVFVACSLLYIDDDATAIATAEVLSFAVMFATCPPLLAFAMYFNFVHSPRHVLRVFQSFPSKKNRTIRSHCTIVALLATLLVTLGSMLLWFLNRLESGASIEDGVVYVVFVGLASLTMPHMGVVAMNFQRMSLIGKVKKS